MLKSTGARSRVLTVAAAATVLVAAGTTTAWSSGLIGSDDIKDNTLTSEDVRNKTLRMQDLDPEVRDQIKQGEPGPVGPAGAKGATGPAGPTGESGVVGAYYAVAYYNAGNTNAGAIATV